MFHAIVAGPFWHPPFYGDGFSREDYEVIALQHIPRNLRDLEPELYQTRWFDIREFHPVKATYWLAECYRRALQDHIAITFDYTRAPFIRGFKSEDVFESRERLTLWQLRQQIDRFGVRYEFFMRYALAWYRDHGWRQMPRPAHIGANEELFADVLMRWNDLTASAIQFCQNHKFLACNWRGEPDQVAYERYLLTEIRKKAHPRFALNAALYRKKMLREEAAIAEFGLELVRDARELVL